MGRNTLLQLIRDGEAVAAGVADRPLSQLLQNDNYFWEVLQAALLGSTVFIRQVTVEADAKVGMPLYYDAANQHYTRALAGVEQDAATGQFRTSAAGQPWGVLHTKHNATLGDLLVFGYAALDLSEALETGETLTAGLYYLSRVTAGKLIRARPPIPVPVLRSDGNGNVFVNPTWDDLIFQHSHLRFDLAAVPAGDHHDPGPGNRHVITHPEPLTDGWLPATAGSFPGVDIPAGAQFGYNLAAHPGLKDAWPPLPPASASLFLDGVLVPSGPTGKVQYTREGIWWMTDCHGEVPWPLDVNTESEAFSHSSLSLSQDDGQPVCPFPYQMRLTLFFSQVAFLTDATVVTSLTTRDDRIKITCEGRPTQSARVGPLEIALDLEFAQADDDPGGYLAVKSFDAVAQRLLRGPVATALWTSNPRVTLTGDAQTTATIASAARTLQHGRVRVDVDTTSERELFVDLTRLDGVIESFVSDTMFLEFPLDQDTSASELASMRCRIRVPAAIDLTAPALTLRLRIMGLGAGTLPGLTVTGRRIPKPSGVAALPTSDSAVTIDTAVAVAGANRYFEVESDEIVVAAGDDYEFTVTRAADDAYAFGVGVLRMSAQLAEASV